MKTMGISRLLFAGVAALLLCAGCGKAVNKAVEKAVESELSKDGKKVNVDMGSSGSPMSMTVTDEKGQTQMTMGASAAIPADFPKDVPKYPGMTVTMAVSETDACTVQATSKDALQKIGDYFKAEAVKGGWTEQSAMTQSGESAMTMLEYAKGDRRFSVMVTSSSDGTAIMINASKQK